MYASLQCLCFLHHKQQQGLAGFYTGLELVFVYRMMTDNNNINVHKVVPEIKEPYYHAVLALTMYLPFFIKQAKSY